MEEKAANASPGTTFKEKIDYLLKFSSLADLGLVSNTSARRIQAHLDGSKSLPGVAVRRLESEYFRYRHTQTLNQLKAVKNYDDEDIQDLKAGTSRHGVNRSTASFARSNNGWSGE